MATVHKSYAEESRKNWGAKIEETQSITLEQINAGCMLRIAAATEAMAKNYTTLLEEREMYKRWYNEAISQRNILSRKLSSKKGIITKLKNRINEFESEKSGNA